MSEERVAGFQQALADAGLEPGRVLSRPFGGGAGYDALPALLEGPEPPTALFVTSDLAAMGLLRAAFDLGLDVPRDLAVVSFDGIEYAAYTRPGLTTVSQPITQMAEVATQLLIDALGGGTIPPGTRALPTELVRRGSCGCSDDFAGANAQVNATGEGAGRERRADGGLGGIRRRLVSMTAESEGLGEAWSAVLAAYEQHLRAERDLSAHSVRAYLTDLESLAMHAERLGVHDPAGLSIRTLRSWLANLQTLGRARTTIARRATSARVFTLWLARTGRAPADAGALLASPKAHRELPVALSEVEVRALLDATVQSLADDGPRGLRDLAILEVLYATGIRVGELAGLDIDDLIAVEGSSGCSARGARSVPCRTGCRRPRRSSCGSSAVAGVRDGRQRRRGVPRDTGEPHRSTSRAKDRARTPRRRRRCA